MVKRQHQSGSEIVSRRIVAALAVAGLTTLTSLSAVADPLRIRMDWATVPGHFAPLIPTVPQYNPNVYRHYGQSYIVEPIRMQGGGATLTALAAGELDVGAVMSPQTLVLAATEAKLDIRVIGEALTTEVPDYLKTSFWVRKTEVRSIADLRGKVIGVIARGSNVDSAVHIIMDRAGMHEPADYQIAEIRFPAMIPALESKRVDAVPLVPPFNRLAEQNSDLAPLFNVGDAFGPVETLMFMAKADFVAKNRPALVDFLEDNIRMRRWMTDPATRAQAIKQVADTAKAPESEFIDWVYTHHDYYYDPNALVDVQRLQRNVDTLKEAGVIPEAIDVTPYVDMSLAKEAAARVKE
jgi:sulfonate transport system substrate-binding protein